MTEDERLRALPLADRLRIAAVGLAVTGALGRWSRLLGWRSRTLSARPSPASVG